MINFLKQIFMVYGEVVLFKRAPANTPQSTLMLWMSIFLASFISFLQLWLSSSFGKLPIPMSISLWMAIFQLGLFLGYMRLVLWSQNALDVWVQLCTCWLMMLFLLDLAAFSFSLVVLGLSWVGITTYIRPLLGWLGIITGLMFSIWQVFFTLKLLKELIQKPMLFAVMVYIGWLGINFLMVILFKQWIPL